MNAAISPENTVVLALLSLVFTIVGFFLGAIPFSLLIGKRFAGVDIRQYGDHNPGMTNVYRAAGWKLALPALLLDFFKGAIPVGLAWFWVGLQGNYILLPAMAPILGHAFSPFLGWRGGKAVAVTFGVWTGLTLGAGPTVLGLLVGVMLFVLTSSAWATILAFLLYGGFIFGYYALSQPELFAIWLGNFAVLLVKYYGDLSALPQIRPSLLHRAARITGIFSRPKSTARKRRRR
jgi:glycerol-3-phosphate acyltransferase PlsY